MRAVGTNSVKKKEEIQHSRARARKREGKEQIECGIIWIQQCPTRKIFLKFFDCFPPMINILIIFPTQYFEEMLKILISDFLNFCSSYFDPSYFQIS